MRIWINWLLFKVSQVEYLQQSHFNFAGISTAIFSWKKRGQMYPCKWFYLYPPNHNGLKTGIKRTTSFWFASAVKTLSDSIFPCFLQLKHSKWQIFINFIFLSQFHNFISFWWVHVQFQLQGLYNYVLLIEECDKIFSM